ncbi:MAG: hypothetical protein DMF63_13940 [Acidobacteria bacterium]|nr:MAG: hypothetical protein DMF63_13940 [Acidobacteriota bacterium]
MKAFSMRISAGIIALAALVFILACSPPSGNINQNQNVAGNSNKTVMALNACKVPSNSAMHAANILNRLKGEINSGDLADNLKPDPASVNGTFTIEVQQAKGKNYFEAYVKGEVRGDDNLKILSDILNNYQNDTDCLRVAYFLEDLNAPNNPSGYKWSSCEYPLHVCPSGECCQIEPNETPGLSPTPTPTPNPVAKQDASSDSNKKANSNK